MNAPALHIKGRRVLDETGRVLMRMKRRDLAPILLRAPAAHKLLSALATIARKRDLNARALGEIAKLEKRLAESKAALLTERVRIDEALRIALSASSTFVAAATQSQPVQDSDGATRTGEAI